jgi:serine-type D-Ala-D-Ala carboxypeptidase/endopeptidase
MLFAHRVRFALLVLLLAFVSTPTLAARKPKATQAPAAKTELFPESFREVIQRGVANGGYRTVAVGVIEGKQRNSFYFGHRDTANSAPADNKSLFEIGALSDIFTDLLFAQAAIEGRLHMADPVSKFLPQDFPFAVPAVAAMSIESLATQRSGFPLVPANLYPANLDDPYANYATEDLLTFLAFFRPDTAASVGGSAYAYSVLNGGLLAHVLGRIYGNSFADILTTTVLIPLGLAQTSQRDEGLLTGYARGEPVAHSHYAGLAGATGLRSSLPDLLAFLQLNLTPNDSKLRAALLLARQPRAAGDGTDQTALGWNIRAVANAESNWPLVWRASETGGFSAFLGFRVDRQRAIVLLGNTSEDLAALGIAWLEEAMPPPAPHGYAPATDTDLAAYPGLYQIAADSEVVVRADNGALSLQLPGEMPQRLRAVDRDVFISDLGGVSVTFMRNVDTINGLVLHLKGSHLAASRLSARAPRLRRSSIVLPNVERQQFTGDYRLDANTWMRVAQRGDALTIQLTMNGPRVVYPYATDHFADLGGSVELAFSRDNTGHIISATLALGGVKRVAVPLRRNFQ